MFEDLGANEMVDLPCLDKGLHKFDASTNEAELGSGGND